MSVVELHVFSEAQEGATYEDLLRVARATESLGFAGFFRSDHYLGIMGDGSPGPTDAWVTLAGLARETNRIRLGTLVSPTTFRLPGPLAIMVAEVDAMSGGRVELGLGSGWYAPEHRAYGIPFPDLHTRYDRFSEQVEIIDGLWRTPVGERFSFQGAHYQLTDSPALPKPVQSPRPPIILGGLGRKRSARLVARFADEFNVAWSPLADIVGDLHQTEDEPGRHRSRPVESRPTPPVRPAASARTRPRYAAAPPCFAKTPEHYAQPGSPARRLRSSTRSASWPSSASAGSTCSFST